MKTEKEYPIKVIVTVQERQKNKLVPPSKSFTIYDSSKEEVLEVITKAIEKS